MLPRLSLRPLGLANFAIVASSGAVLAVVPRSDTADALRALTCRRASARRAVTVSLRASSANDNCTCERCVA